MSAVKKFGECKVSVSKIATVTQTKGIIHGVDIEYTSDELSEGLCAQEFAITDVKRLGSSKSVVLTFQGEVLPEHVYFGYLRYNVKLYIPNPIRCFQCQRWGHIAKNCRSVLRCASCGDKHDTRECPNPSNTDKCCNCGGNHKASSKECTFYEEAKEILKVKTEQKMKYSDAVKQVKGKARPVVPPPDKEMSSPCLDTQQRKNGGSGHSVSVSNDVRQEDNFKWDDFLVFMVKASVLFSDSGFQDKSMVEKISVLSDMIREFFHVMIDTNKACHAVLAKDSLLSVHMNKNI